LGEQRYIQGFDGVKLEGQSLLERRKHEWKDNIKMGI
jgi:hypothetical protein